MSTVDSPVSRIAAPRRSSFQRFLAWIMLAVGLLFVLLVLAAPSEPGTEAEKGEPVVIVFGLVMAIAGGAWLWVSKRRDATSREQWEDRVVLAVAARHEGRATIAQVTLETPLSAAEAETVINRLCGRNIAQPDLMDDGTVIYQFGMLGRP